MMEQITDFLKDLRERFASPFFFSFLISWILWNWEVAVALVWYNAELYPFKGDLIEFIDDNTSNLRSIFLPIISSTLYVGLIKNLVSAFVSWAMTWGENWNLRISKESNVPMSKFLAYRDMYTKSHDELQKVIQDESKTIQNYEALRLDKTKVDAENVALKGEVEILKVSNNDLELKRNTLVNELKGLEELVKDKEEVFLMSQTLVQNYDRVAFMNGRWKFVYNNTLRKLHLEEGFDIRDGTINTVHEGRTVSTYRINFFFHDVVNHKILMLLTFIEGTIQANYIANMNSEVEIFKADMDIQHRTYFRAKYAPVLIHQLELRDDGKRMTGNENVEGLISYERV